MEKPKDRAFSFLKVNDRPPKPRLRGVTEIRGPYYTPMGKRYLQDVLETMGAYVDALKFAGGSFSLMPRQAVKELIDLCHDYDVLVDTGGFMDHVMTQGKAARLLPRNWRPREHATPNGPSHRRSGSWTQGHT